MADIDRDFCDLATSPLHVGGKWTSRAVDALRAGPLRFGELLDRLHPVTPRVLAASLRAMERDGFVSRTVVERRVPARVEYALTELGRSLIAPIEAACVWTRTHGHDVARARRLAEQRRER